MQIFLFILFGFLAGIIGGMGMGGGTLLVPLLSFLVKTDNVWWIIIPAVLSAVGGAFTAGITDNKILRYCFAAFLIAVGIWQLVIAIRFEAKRHRDKNLPVPVRPMLPAAVSDRNDKD